jgi:hypothetical protein
MRKAFLGHNIPYRFGIVEMGESKFENSYLYSNRRAFSIKKRVCGN